MHRPRAPRTLAVRLAWAIAGFALLAGGCGMFGGSSTAAFCDAVEEMTTIRERFDFDVEVDSSDSPEEVAAKLAEANEAMEQVADEVDRLMTALERTAPSEIRDDVRTVARVSRSFYERVRRGEQPDLDSVDIPEAVAAGERLRLYVKEECGLDVDSIAPTAETDVSIPDLPPPSMPDPMPVPPPPPAPPPPPSIPSQP